MSKNKPLTQKAILQREKRKEALESIGWFIDALWGEYEEATLTKEHRGILIRFVSLNLTANNKERLEDFVSNVLNCYISNPDNDFSDAMRKTVESDWERRLWVQQLRGYLHKRKYDQAALEQKTFNDRKQLIQSLCVDRKIKLTKEFYLALLRFIEQDLVVNDREKLKEFAGYMLDFYKSGSSFPGAMKTMVAQYEQSRSLKEKILRKQIKKPRYYPG